MPQTIRFFRGWLFLTALVLAGTAQAFAEAPYLKEVHPTPSTKQDYNLFTYPEIMLYFNVNGDVRFGSVDLIYRTWDGEKSIPMDYKEQITYPNRLRYDLDLKSAINKVKPEMVNKTPFMVRITDPTLDGVPVEGTYVNKETGCIELKYLYLKVTAVTDIIYPETFLSYWTEDDENGIVKVTYDYKLAPVKMQNEMTVGIHAGAFLNYLDSGDDWPRLPDASVEIDGNILTLDLREVLREPEDPELDVVTIRIWGVKDADGLETDFQGGNLIQIIDLPYVNLHTGYITYEFTPAGGEIADEESIELWVKKETFNQLKIDSFTYTIEATGEEIPISLDETEAGSDPYEAGSMIYNIPVPEAVRQSAGDITLTAETTSADGYPHEISAVFHNETPKQSGVGLPAAPAGSRYEVYSIEGLRVMSTEDAGALRTLPPGLYIVNDGRSCRKIRL